jgi:peptide/nickel transport system permease protein
MFGTIVKRILQGILVLVLVVIITFVVLRLIPGDPARQMASDGSAQAVEEIRAEMGLDKPIYVQLFEYIPKLLTGQLGWSYFQKAPVFDVIVNTAPFTYALLFSAMILGVIMGLIFGIIAAVKAHTWVDRALSAIAVVFQSMPTYWVATMLILIVSVQWGLLPAVGYKSPKYLILPAFVVSIPIFTAVLRNVRQNVMDGLSQEFSRAARARGISHITILFKYAFRNSLIPFITQIGGQVGVSLGTCVLIESVFSLPGMGMQILNAVLRRDYNLVQGLILILAATFVLINAIIDISYSYLDPRIRKAQGGL